MIEIKFNRQQLTRIEKEKYSRILEVVIAMIGKFNKHIESLKDVVSTEVKIIFK